MARGAEKARAATASGPGTAAGGGACLLLDLPGLFIHCSALVCSCWPFLSWSGWQGSNARDLFTPGTQPEAWFPP